MVSLSLAHTLLITDPDPATNEDKTTRGGHAHR